MKTAEFGQPCRALEAGRCRICGCTQVTACEVTTGNGSRACAWADETLTLCDNHNCIAAARAELGIKPDVKSEQ